MSTVIELTNVAEVSWEKSAEDTSPGYRCHVAMVREDDGTYSAIVVNLPGCGSCGDSEDQAMENVREAICGVIESYNARGLDIPWIIHPELEDWPEDAIVGDKWIVVNA